MCGILYAKLKNDNPDFADFFKEALQLMDYRGKNHTGYFQEANNYFGHVRLSILDLSERSNQPMISENNIFLFKGEIYNYKKLVQQAASDTLALSQLLPNNIDITGKLAGMYAILTYDRKTAAVKVLRDFYGEKPIYYYLDDYIFIVSSTIKAITHLLYKTFKKQLNIHPSAIGEYLLCGYIREPKTIYENIFMLSSSHELLFSSDWKLTIENNFNKMLESSSEPSKTHILNALQTTDVKPGLLLSSGVDSTYLLDLMNEVLNEFAILTYKSPFQTQDESVAAVRNVKTICKDKKVEVNIIENHQALLDLYNHYPAILEQPSSDGFQLFNILSVNRMQNDELKLVILGTGGDELYGGYHSFRNYWKVYALRKFTLWKNWLPVKYQRFFKIDSKRQHNVESYYFLYRICHQFLSYVPDFMVKQLFMEFIQEMNKYGLNETQTYSKKIKLFESFDYMRNQLLRDADNISLYCGYEARNPLLSIMPFACKPDNKKMMKQALKDKHKICSPQKKGFTFGQAGNSIPHYLFKKISEYNKQYHIFSSEMINKIKQSDSALIRKSYILLNWLHTNKIEATQLQKFWRDFSSVF